MAEEGYIIWNVDCGQQLTIKTTDEESVPDFFWYQFNPALQYFRHLFSDSEIEDIKSVGAIHWKIQPAYKQKAQRDDNGKVIVTGNLERFWQ